jgi:hypothetical protein
MGVGLDEDLSIFAILPGGPADLAGLRPGMKILAVEGQRFSSPDALHAWIGDLKDRVAVKIETDQGIYSVVPRVPEIQQCYWEVRGGRVESAGAGAGWNPAGGGAWGRGSAHDRFYRATCRFQDGFLMTINSQWQM